MRRTVNSAVLVLVAFAAPACRAPRMDPEPAPRGATARPRLVIAHRGNAAARVENPVGAFASAFDVGADVVEMDVRLTRDGVPIIFHDGELERVTAASGPIAAWTLERLRTLRAGSRADANAGDPIPTLEEALQVARGRGRVLLDIKADGMAGTIAAIFARLGLPEDMAVVGVWTSAQADEYRKHLPRAQIFSSQDVPPGPAAEYAAAQRRLGIDGLEVWWPHLTPALVEAAHAHGMTVWVYTVNEGATVRRMLRLGVAGIETDIPELVAHLVREHAEEQAAPPEAGSPRPDRP